MRTFLLINAALLLMISCASAQVADPGEAVPAFQSEPDASDEIAAEIHVAEPDESQIDWDALNARDPWQQSPMRQLRSPRRASSAATWSRDDRSNGSAGVSVQQSLFPAWNANAGIDMDVARLSAPVTSSATIPDRLQSDRQLLNSSAAAWMTAKVSGVSFLWDQTAIEARTNPLQQTRFGTSMTKSLPLWGDQFMLTLQHSYFVTQHGALTGLGGASDDGRNLDLDRSARLKVTDTGMTLLAGQSRSSVDHRWLNRIGAEQQLFGGVSITGSISQLPDGGSNSSISAGFRRRW